MSRTLSISDLLVPGNAMLYAKQSTGHEGSSGEHKTPVMVKALSLTESPMNHCHDDRRTNRIFLSTVHYHLPEIKLPRNWITGVRHYTQPIGGETLDHYGTCFSS